MKSGQIESVLVTGGAGFIGSHVVRQLLERGKRVLVVDNLSTGRLDNLAPVSTAIEFVEGSVADEGLIRELVCRADAVIHLAASVGNRLVARRPLESIENNLRGTSRLLAACAQYQRPVLLASSSEVYGRSTQFPFTEDADLVLGKSTSPRWLYAVSKLTNEFEAMAYARQSNLPVIVCRFFNVVGPRQSGRYGMVLPRFVRQALEEKPITVYGDGEQVRCYSHVREIAGAILGLLECEAAYGRIINLGNQKTYTVRELAEHVQALAGTASEIVYQAFEDVYGPDYDDMQRRQPDVSTARELIGFEASVPLDEIIADVIAWQRADWTRIQREQDY